MHAWEAIQKSVDYIEDHLCEEIKIEDLANVVSLSPFYFQRLFSRLVNKPVNEYIKLRRLANATSALEDKLRIVDIALKYGFSSHGNFTRAFKEAYGITPDEYRKLPLKLTQFVKPELILNYVMVDENVPLITDGIVIEVSRKKLDVPRTFVGIECEIPICQLMGGETTSVAVAYGLWEDFRKQKNNIPNLMKDGNELGALYMGDAKEGCCTYMAGVEVEFGTKVEGFKTFVLPVAEYLVCGFEAENFQELVNSALFKADKFMGRWMEKHRLTTTEIAIEMYYPPTAKSAYLEHWVIPVPKI